MKPNTEVEVPDIYDDEIRYHYILSICFQPIPMEIIPKETNNHWENSDEFILTESTHTITTTKWNNNKPLIKRRTEFRGVGVDGMYDYISLMKDLKRQI